MPKAELIQQAKDVADEVAIKADEYSGAFGQAKQYIIEHFGENGLIAAYVALGVIALVLVLRVAKTSFNALKYLAVPALILAGLATYFLQVDFAVSLPVSVTACSLLLLFKG